MSRAILYSMYLLGFLTKIHVSQAIVISDVMRKILQGATDNFEKDIDSVDSEEDLAPQITVVKQVPESIRKQFTSANDKDIVRWEMYITYPYLLWDPLTQFKNVFSKKKLNCPLCSNDGVLSSHLRRSSEWFNGRKVRLNPRVFFDVHSPTLLVSAKYKCRYSHEIAACHPVILQLLQNYVQIPFFLTHRQGFSLTLINRVEKLVDEGQSLEEIERFIKEQYQRTYDNFQASFSSDLDKSKSLGVSYEESEIHFPTFNPYNFPRPTFTILMDTFIKRFFQNEHLYESSINSLKAQCMTFDHTFKNLCNIGYKSEDKKWVNQYNSMFCVLNEKGEVIHWQFTNGNFEETQAINLITTLKGKFEPGFFGMVCVDDCCKWQELLKEIWPQALIKQNLNHAVQQFCKKSRKKATYDETMVRDYEQVFRNPLDTGDTREMETAPKHTIMTNLEHFVAKWSHMKYDGVRMLTKGQLDAIEEIRPHIMKGCLSGIPACCSNYLSKDKREKIKKLLCRKIGVQLAYVKFSRFFFNHNQQLGNKESMDSLRYKEYVKVCEEIELNLATSGDGGGVQLNADVMKRQPALDDVISTSVPMTSTEVDEILATLEEIMETERKKLNTTDIPMTDGSDLVENFENLEKCTSILQHALAIFKVVLLVENVWSFNQDKLQKIPFLFQNDENSSPSNNPEEIHEARRLQNNAKAFGFNIVPVTGDGNCFFTSVAFQLLQVLSNNCPTEILEVLQPLGITANSGAQELSVMLRELVVNEWLTNENDYQSFLIGVDLQSEAQRFRRDGEFAGALGDALPVAMANLLNIPILIFTTVHNMPIVYVAPRASSSRDAVIYLSYTQQGAGHYDALVAKVENSNNNKTTEVTASSGETSDKQPRVNDTKEEAVKTKEVKGTTRGKTWCRCGINSNKNQHTEKLPRSYRQSKRCKCFKANLLCSEMCSCHGRCGGTECGGRGAKVRRRTESETLTRKARPRKLHDIQQVETCPNSKTFLDSMFPDPVVSNSETNMLEYKILLSITLKTLAELSKLVNHILTVRKDME